MEALYDLKDMLCDQVEEVVKKGDISPSEVEMMYKVIDIIKDIVTIDAMENADYSYDYMNESGNSMRYSRDGRRGRDGDSDGRYSERSYPRRMMSRDNYSRHDEKEYLKQQINELQRKVDSM
jgi:hypothetical protein